LSFENQKNPLKIKKTSETQNVDFQVIFQKKNPFMINFKPQILVKLLFTGSSVSKYFKILLVYMFCGFQKLKNLKKPQKT